MNLGNRITEARAAMRAEFEAEVIRLAATVHTEGDTLVATWSEVGRQTTSATLSTVGERLVLTETAIIRVPKELPEDLVGRFGHRSAVVGRLRDHLGMVERVVGVPLLNPPEPLKVVRA